MSLLQYFTVVEHYWKWIALGASAGLGILLIRRRIAGPLCRSKALLNGKTIIITGASSGIGKATALELAERHGRVILACRNVEKAEQAKKDIRSKTKNGELVVKKLDLASMKSVRLFAEEINREEACVHVLVNNAGVYQCPHELTQDGLEMQMAVNHFGHFLLVNLLLDKLKASAPSRVVIVSSGLSKFGTIDFDNLDGSKGYNAAAGYKNSKLANNLFAQELARRTAGTGIGVHCLRPGMVRTDLGRHVPLNVIFRILFRPFAWLLLRSPYEGCQTVLHCILAEELNGATGRFYANCAVEDWSQPSIDKTVASQLWQVSEQLTCVTKKFYD